MIYIITAQVDGEKVVIEYDRNTSRHQAKQAFKLLYPTARRMVVIEMKQKAENDKLALLGKAEANKRRKNQLEKNLEDRARREQANPYYH